MIYELAVFCWFSSGVVYIKVTWNRDGIYSSLSLVVEFVIFPQICRSRNIPVVVLVVVGFSFWCLMTGGEFVVFHTSLDSNVQAWLKAKKMKYLHVNSFNTRRNGFLKRAGLPVWDKVLLFPNLLCFRYTSDHLDRNECFLRNGILTCNTLVPSSQSNCWKTGAPKLE